MDNQEKDLIQLDIMLLLRRIWEKKILIVLVTLLFTAASLAYSIFLVTPQYSSTTKVYVVNQKKDDKAITTQDVQLGSLLVKDYKEIILSNKVMEDAAEKSGLGFTAKQLAGKVSVEAPKDTRIISITVQDKDPQVASDLANTVKSVSADQIKEVTKIDDVTTLEEAKAATSPSSPNIPRNGILATVLGFIIAVAGVVLFELLDDRVKRAEDIEEGMGLVLLGVVPDTKQERNKVKIHGTN